MNKKKKLFPSYTLLEMLLVMGILVVLGALGVGGYLGTKETTVARENVQKIIQDIQLARSKAMLLEKGSDENWIYGIGLDFTKTDDINEKGTYNFFKWCSEFSNFGDEKTKAVLPSFDASKNVNDIGIANICGQMGQPYKNARMPYCYTNSCETGFMSLVAIPGDDLTIIDREIGQMVTVDANGDGWYPAYVFFEAVTGRAILYNKFGWPYNYKNGNGEIKNMIPLDIAIKRKYSSRFDLITIYPLSGTVIHHVYSKADANPLCSDSINYLKCITFEGVKYNRYGISEEINSYRD